MSEPSSRLSKLSRQELASVLAKLKGGGGRPEAATPPLVARPRDAAALPLSFAQQRLWLQNQLDPGSPAYNVPGGLRLNGPLQVAPLWTALAEVVRRHEALRTVFRAQGGVPQQEVVPWSLEPAVVDVSALGSAEVVLARLGAVEARRPFDLAQGPLLRVRLLRLAAERHALLVTFHHIVSDGWSLAVFLGEVAVLYRAFAAGRPSPLPSLAIQYVDFAAWQREWLSAEVLERQLTWWRQELAGLPDALELPSDRPRPAYQSLEGRRLTFTWPAEQRQRVVALARSLGTTPFVVALAAWHTFLSRLTGVSDVVVGTTIANRTRSELEGLIGFFVNTLALRGRPSRGKSFARLVAEVRETTLGAQAHQDLPFEKLVEELAPQRSLAHSPIFQVALDYQGDPLAGVQLPGLSFAPLSFDGGTSKFDLLLSITEGEGFSGYLEFSTALFDEATAARWLAGWRRLLLATCENAETQLSALPLLSTAETIQLLGEWGDGGVLVAPPSTLPELLAAAVAATPDKVALVSEDGRLSYAELSARAHSLAGQLAALGVGPEVKVGICLPRTEGLVVAMWAVLAAGGAYVPFDPPGQRRPGRGVPAERLNFLFEDSGMEVLLTEAALDRELPSHRARTLTVDRHGRAEGPSAPVVLAATPENLAYIIYTSGSTGRPKGVAISHRAPVAFACWARVEFSAAQREGVFAATSVCFDLSIFELFVTLAWSGKVVLGDDALHLPRHSAVSEVRLLNTVPSAIAALVHQDALPAGVETVNLAGEALKRLLVEEIYACPGERVVNNLYGPSEDTTYSTWTRVPAGMSEPPRIGRPLPGTFAYVLDRERRLLPPGVPGHLHLAGAGLARGYSNRPALTAERFVPDAFAKSGAGGRMYRTGDLARWLVNGQLDFLGRIDHQVKVRGFRIELGEIEAALLSHPAISHAVAVARPDSSGELWLVAYVVGREALPEAAELLGYLSRYLPDYMLPARLVALPALPLTPNGKVDRAALPEPDGAADKPQAHRAPTTAVEQRLAGFFAELLGQDQVGLDDGFFELGGHSLKASQLVARIRDAWAVELPLKVIFEAPTVAGLARAIEAEQAIGQGAEPAGLSPTVAAESPEISFAQRRLWFLEQLEPDSLAYLLTASFAALGRLDVAALCRGFAAVQARHEAMRTVFIERDGEPEARFAATTAVRLPVVDLAAMGASARAEGLVAAFVRRPFDLSRGPLWRGGLLRLSATEHRLTVVFHHIVSDGWSMGLLVHEVAAAYGALVSGRRVELPPLAATTSEHARRQRQWLMSPARETELAYWQERLAAVPVLDLPTDHPRRITSHRPSFELPVSLAADLDTRLRHFAESRGVTPFMVLLAAFDALLARLSGQDDFAVGTPVAGRGRRETENLIGLFVNTLVLRADLGGTLSFASLVERTRRLVLADFAHQELPFDQLTTALAPERNRAVTPFFQVMLALNNAPQQRPVLPGVALEARPVVRSGAKFELLLSLNATAESLAGELVADRGLFDPTTTRRMWGWYENLLRAALSAPERLLSELPLSSPAERHQLAREWVGDWVAERASVVAVEPRRLWVGERVAARVAERPHGIALVATEAASGLTEVFSYGELSRRAERLAEALAALGVGPEKVVAVLAPRSAALVVGEWAALRVGAAFLPLDPAAPAERLTYQLSDARAAAWVVAEGHEGGAEPAGTPRLRLSLSGELLTAVAGRPVLPAAWPAAADQLAYVIYTSGSTGKPKGAELTHRGFSNLLAWRLGTFPTAAGEAVTLAAGPAFDPSVLEVWGGLAAGATLHVLEPELVREPQAVLGRFAERRVVYSYLPTSVAESVLGESWPEDLALSFLVCGGDRLKRGLPATSGARLANFYGPAENTVDSVFGLSGPGEPPSPIGRPLPGVALHVVDAHGRPRPLGVPGELWLSGIGVGRGYRHQPALSAQRFLPDPFATRPGRRLYRTGDQVRFLADGRLDFLGRLDQQVKIRGIRVELGEIESVLVSHPKVVEAAVAWRDDLLAEPVLVAYAVGRAEVEAEELKAWLGRQLTPVMVPPLWVFLPALPKNPSGKIDRRALPRPELEPDAGWVPPRTPLERVVATVFESVLGRERVGAEDDFFRLGGHSLKATQLASRLRRELSVALPLATVFEASTVSALAAVIAQSAEAGEGKITRLERGGDLPLSFAQRRLWFLEQLDPGGASYLVPALFTLEGHIEPWALARGLSAIVERHEVLRSVVVTVNGEPSVRLVEPRPVGLPLVDLSALAESSGCAGALAELAARRPFDLGRWPLLRWLLLRTGQERHQLVAVKHHIVTDGWSGEIFLRELEELYTTALQGRPAHLPELSVQYPDVAAWQHSWLSAARRERQLGYWRARLAELPALSLPSDRPRPARQDLAGLTLSLRFAPADVAALEALAAAHGATPFMAWAALVEAWLGRLAGQRDFGLGTPVAGRTRAELEGLIGCFVNTLVLRADLRQQPSFVELLGRTRADALGAFSHQELPFEQLVEELTPARDLAVPPLAQVMLTFRAEPAATLRLGEARVTPRPLSTHTAKFDLLLALTPTADGFGGLIEAASALFDQVTVERWTSHLAVLLAEVVRRPEAPLARLSFLTGEQERQLLSFEEEGAAPLSERRLQDLIAERAAERPDAVALVTAGERLSYAALEERAETLAGVLRTHGVGAESRVGVCLPRGTAMVVSMLAVWKAEGAYVPLEPPLGEGARERWAGILADAGLHLALMHRDLPLTHQAELRHLPGGRALVVDEAGFAGTAATPPGPPRVVSPDLAAYLIYTSGSTGKPKGVVISHRSAVARAHWALSAFSDEERDGVLFATSTAFDLSIFELWMTLAWGGKVVLAENALSLAEHPAAWEVRTVNTVPSAIAELARMKVIPGSVVTVNLAGEMLPQPLVAAVYAAASVERVWNLYGPSEDTTYSTGAVIPREGSSPPPIGRPLPGTRGYVLDDGLNRVPLGAVGELWLAGGGLSRGYLDRPAFTAERYRPCPWGEAGERMYQTGDLVRYRAGGALEYLGRGDHQVKVRGFRVELGEIEAALLALPGVREAVVVARGRGAELELLAYVVGAGEPASWRQELAGRLPEHMVPAIFEPLSELPKNSNGKVDRKRLPEPVASRSEMVFVAPRNILEARVAECFAAVLGLERVSVLDSFFGLGGHSLKATQLVSRLRDSLGVELPLKRLFEAPTVAALAAELERAQQAAPLRLTTAGGGEITRLPRGGWLPLSYAQRRLWFLDQLDPASRAYVVPGRFVASGRLDARALRAAVAAIVERHEALRVEFLAPEVVGWEASRGEPMARVVANAVLVMPVVDVSALGAAAAADRLAEMFVARPFSLDRWPLLRLMMVRLGGERHELLVSMHHIVTDGWSLGVFLAELAAGYEAARLGRAAELPELPVQYADFAAWQHQRLASPLEEMVLGYWRERLEGVSPLALPTDRPRPAVQSLEGGGLPLAWPAARLEPLMALAREQGATAFMALLAVLQIWLARLSGQRDFAIGSPVAGRGRSELDRLIGFFVNTLVLRAELAGRPSFREVLSRTRQATLAAFEHQELPFERLVEAVAPERGLAQTPIFQVMFTYLAVPLGRMELPDLCLDPRPLPSRTAKFDLLVGLAEAADGWSGAVEYATALFDPATISRWIKNLELLLDGVAEQPDREISQLPFLTAEEQQQLLSGFACDGPAPASDLLLHQLFEQQARIHPRETALVTPTARLSYQELDLRANQLAQRLRRLGVGAESRVGICLPREVAMVVAMLAVEKAGGAYVPFDPPATAAKTERFGIIFADAAMELVLAQQADVDLLPTFSGRVLVVDELGAPEGDESLANTPPPVWATADNAAYLIYTSGSTGKPKGVVITHRSAVALAAWAREAFTDEQRSGVLAATSICFDLSVFELWVTLGLGGKVILAENALRLPEHPAASEVRLVNTVPSAIAELARQGLIPPSVATINLAGEALKQVLVETLYATSTVEAVWNLYGPSEDTTYSTWARVTKAAELAPAIGRPLPGSAAYVLDRELRLVPQGAVGELWLAGAGLARGYHARPGLTAERFRPNPFGGVAAPAGAGSRLYQTGDLVRFRPDGQLDYLGRADFQVKVRGFRIELGEVEAALLALPGVREAVVTAEGEGGDKRLVAYLALAEGAAAEAGVVEGFRQLLAARLPDYMVPSLWIPLVELPKNANGKLDRKRLPRPETAWRAGAGYVAPRSPLEARVAEIFAEVLGLPKVGVEDSFFGLGGHSLKATQLAARLRRVFLVRLPVKTVFETPTVAGMAQRIAAAARATEGTIQRLPRGGPLPMSFAQRRLWFLDQLEPGSLAYLVPALFAVEGQLDARVLSWSLSEIVRRHEALRSVFVRGEEEPYVTLVSPTNLPLPVVDLSVLDSHVPRPEGAWRERVAGSWAKPTTLTERAESGPLGPAKTCESRADRLAALAASRPFLLSQWPQLRWLLLRLGEKSHLLTVVKHHIVTDGWSGEVFLRELGALYRAALAGEPSPLPELVLQYPDVAGWQRSRLELGLAEEQLSYWRGRLADLPVLSLPTDRPREPFASRRAGTLAVSLPAAGLAALAQRLGATPFMAWAALFQGLLGRLSGQRDFGLGTPVAGRSREELEGLIGFFVNTLVLRADLSHQPSLTEVITRVRHDALAAFEHQDLPFERLVEELAPSRDLSTPPLFQVLLTVRSEGFAGLELPGLKLAPRPLPATTAKVDLVLALSENGERVEGVIEFSRALFDESTIRRWAGELGRLLDSAVASPERPLMDLPVMSAAEHQQLLVEWTSHYHQGVLLDDEARPVPLGARGRLSNSAAEPASSEWGRHRTDGSIEWLPLPVVAEASDEAAANRAPATAGEKAVAELFAELLGVDGVSAGANFFTLGGHSILATRLTSRLASQFRIEVPVAWVFAAPTVAALAARLEASAGPVADEAASSDMLVKLPRGGALPLSFAQRRLWFLDQLDPGSLAYLVPGFVSAEGRLDVAALAASLAEIVRRHESLRTVFERGDEEPVARVVDGTVPLPVVDLSALSERAGQGVLKASSALEVVTAALARRLARLPFELSSFPLVRWLLIRERVESHHLALSLHHIVTDGWSQGVFLRELAELYRARLEGGIARLPELAFQYADYAAWQRRFLAGGRRERQLDYWRQRLAGVPPLALPTDRPRPPVQSLAGANVRLELPAARLRPLLAEAGRRGGTPFMALLAVTFAWLSRLSGQRDFAVGTPVAGRGRTEIEPLIGFFVNTLVLRAELGGRPSFAELLARVQRLAVEAYDHQDVPFEELVEELAPERGLAVSPLFQAMFTLLSVDLAAVDLPAPEGRTLRLTPSGMSNDTAKFDLLLGFSETKNGLSGVLEYSTALFDRATIERWAASFETLLVAAAASPQMPLALLPFLSKSEETQLLHWEEGGAVAGSEKLLHELVAEQAARRPWATALVTADEYLSYRELDRRANHLAWALQEAGVGPEVRVGVYLPRTAAMVVALLAVHKAGGAYVPFDPPASAGAGAAVSERQEMIFADGRLHLVLAHQADFARLPALGGRALAVDEEGRPEGWQCLTDAPPPCWATPDNAAYLIYTSGSTGRPKGVVIAHRPAVVLAAWAKEAFRDDERDGVLAATSICFDLSVFELWVTLGLGGKVILADNALHLVEHPAAHEVRLINTVPSAIAELARLKVIPSSVCTVNLAGEALKQPLVETVYAAARVEQVWNLYGPSEDTTYSTWAKVPSQPQVVGGAALPPAIGRPLAGTQGYLLDAELGRVPQGAVGELWLAGAGLSRGYHDRPALTAERYRPNPFGVAGSRMYKTGDLARFRPDGELDYLGRSDHQVKVRGFRIELGEVETALLTLAGVRESVVTAQELGGEKVLVAYLAPATAAAVEGFRRVLASRLPDYMVPAVWVALAELPHNSNGKVDRKRLPSPELGARQGEGYVAPRTPLETELAQVFAVVLGLERVGVFDSFFSLGGHSLKATQLVSRLGEALGRKVPLREVFEAPTVAALAERLGGVPAAAAPSHSPALVAGPRPENLPLSYGQERLWILDRIEAGNAAYNIPMALTLKGRLDMAAFSAALAALVRRHESLRTRFVTQRGQPFQAIADDVDCRLPVVDVGALAVSPTSRRDQVLRLAHREAMLPFDLERGPLFRGRLVRLHEGEHALFFDLHHSIADGWSVSVLVREWVDLYEAALAGREAELPAAPLQYPDYALWQRRWLLGTEAEAQLGYWRRQLAGLPQGLDLPTDWPRPVVRTFSGARESAVVPPEVTTSLRALAARHQASLYMVLLAAFKLLLKRWSGEDDLAVGTPIAGRNQPELEGMVGMFLNSLVLRSDLSGDPSFAELLGRVRQVTLDAYAHQDLPFEKLLDELKPERDLSRTPFFQVFFNMLNFPKAERTLSELAVEELAPPELPSKFDVTVYLAERELTLHLDWVYNATLFSRERAAEMVAQYLTVLSQVARSPEAPISRLSLLTPAALAALPDPTLPLSDHWNGSFSELFAARARERPEKIALVDETASWTYAELDRQANRVAWWLLRAGVRVGDPVAIWAHRGGAAAWALLATSKAGGAFVMLDPSYPARRLVMMLEQARPKAFLVLAEAPDVPSEVEAFVAGLPRCPSLELPSLGQSMGFLAGEPTDDPEVEVGPDDLAYVAFTSGSTGQPKGVMGRQGPLTHFLPWQCRTLDFSAEDRFSLLSGLAHDPLQRDVVTPLYLGATLCVPRPQDVLAAGGAAAWMARLRVSIAHLTPAMGQVLVEPAGGRESETLTALSRVLLVGDILTRRDVDRLRHLAPSVVVVNLYGSTETQRAVAYHVATAQLDAPGGPDRRAKQILPLGRGMEDVQLVVLAGGAKAAGNPEATRGARAGVGELGEICVRSPHLAAGYLGDPELSAARFVTNPFGSDPRDRVYRTGDLGRYLPNGEVTFAGRADKQVKIRGFRIELGEIEAQLGRIPGVVEAVVLPRGEASTRRLVAFVVAAPGLIFASGDLRELISARVPSYMVPSSFLQLSKLPLTPNGKVDREALNAMDEAPKSAPTGRDAPATAAEEKIAALFRDLLGLGEVGVEENFFELGGNSLLLVQLHGRLQESFGTTMPMTDLFDHPTIRALARHLAPETEAGEAAVAAAADEGWSDRFKQGRERLKARSRAARAGTRATISDSGASDESREGSNETI